MPALAVDNLYSLEREVVSIFGRGTGAADADLTGVKGKGIASVARTEVGLHTITLQDKWPGLLMFKGRVIDATSPDDWEVVVVSEAVATSKTIDIAVFKGGVAADLSTDEKLLVEVVLSNGAGAAKGY